MIDYIVSNNSTIPIINKNRIKKEKKAYNELLIHGQNSQLTTSLQFTKFNVFMLTLDYNNQDDIQHQIKNLFNLNNNLAKYILKNTMVW